ncbi:hypothetical protein THAOC_25093 [Thalassiosira oceanica]|uniref:Uncharacterized protein n=1 Tax=Thalassiosira oceanica TaxID=159749 RepID=K0S913_THAOC|nr:hypothetical protein THAOC_25093 [Thalassiosira oceanica]|eukprot:EJK55197.1 hypothetical protein THAOC_25093 [Thalassiosira oceanica]
MSAAAARRRKQAQKRRSAKTGGALAGDPVRGRLDALLADPSLSDEGVAYDALQLAQSVVRRNVKIGDFACAVDVAYETSLALLSKSGRVAVSSQLLAELINVLGETYTACDAEWVARFTKLDGAYRAALDGDENMSSEERGRLQRLHLLFLKKGLKWSNDLGSVRYGNRGMHSLLGDHCWNMSCDASVVDKEKPLERERESDGSTAEEVAIELRGEAVGHYAMAERIDAILQKLKGLPGPTDEETAAGHVCPPALRDELLTRAVMVLLAIEDLRGARSLVASFLADVSDRPLAELKKSYLDKTDGRSPSHVMFCSMLVRICEKDVKTAPLFKWLLKNFGAELMTVHDREVIKAYTTKIGRVYFNIQPPPSMVDMMENVMSGRDDDDNNGRSDTNLEALGSGSDDNDNTSDLATQTPSNKSSMKTIHSSVSSTGNPEKPISRAAATPLKTGSLKLKPSPQSVADPPFDPPFADLSGHDLMKPPTIVRHLTTSHERTETSKPAGVNAKGLSSERVESIIEMKRQQNQHLEEDEGIEDNCSGASVPSYVLDLARNRLKKYLPSRGGKGESTSYVQLQHKAGPHAPVALLNNSVGSSHAPNPIGEDEKASFDSSHNKYRDLSCGEVIEPTSVSAASNEEALKGLLSEDVTRVTNLPWSENSTEREVDVVISGRYTGPVNMKLQPHGDGLLVVDGITFEAVWTHGKLSTDLTVHEDDPVKMTGDDDKKIAKKMNIRYIIGKRSKKSTADSAALKYQLGDTLRSQKDIITKRSKSEATHSASILKAAGASMSEGCQCKLTRGKPAAPKEVSPPASAAPPEKADAPKKKAKKAALAKAVSKKSTKSATFMGATTKATKHEASTKKKKDLHPPRAHPRRDRSDMSGHQKWDALAASAGLGKKGRGYQYLNV